MNTQDTLQGVYSLGKNGIGFVKNKERNLVIEIPKHESNTALHRDIVDIQITDTKKNEGKVLSVVKRANAGFTGIYKKQGEHMVVDTDNFKVQSIVIPKGNDMGAKKGNKVFAVIDQYGNPLVGHIQKDLGKPGSNDANMNGIALEQGFDFSFPKDVEEEADELEKIGITDKDRAERRDMRDTLTFTIDPADAKDFDDALSFETKDDGNYEIGIHIADVSHYVRPGSALDREAQKRTTSVYLVDRTIPMLPEVLSNGLCSLRQDEEKLAYSAVFTINPQSAEVLDSWYGRTIINSNKRFTYEEAQDILDAGEGLYHHELSELNRLAKVYEEQRRNNGALNFETHEVKFVLDEQGKPIDVKVKDRIDTNKLIEEFMLLANSGVATFAQENDSPFFVYRVHDKPDTERAQKLRDFLRLIGINDVQLVDGYIQPKVLQRIITESEGSPLYDTLQTVIVRSMQKAIYTTKNIGHFGLAFGSYSHFTSPIRRYPDVLAHRLIEHVIQGTAPDFDQSWHEKMCDHCSQQEQAAVTAERNSVKLKQVEYMADRNIHDTFDGIVTGASKFGVFVAEEHSRSEGMIRLSDLGNDFWEYHEQTGTVKGKKSGKTFKIGDTLKIMIKKVDLEKKLIDYKLPPEKKNHRAKK
jgi:ribonuclease R